jgi:hypothetical protein
LNLTRWEDRWAQAAIGAIFPGLPEEGFGDIAAMDVPGFLRRVLRAVPFRAALGLRLAIWLVAFAPLFVVGRWTTIAGLALAERETLIARLGASETYAIRSLVMILKTMGALLYAGDDGVRARMRAPAASRSLVALRVKGVRIGG